jgi:hypothetical protein
MLYDFVVFPLRQSLRLARLSSLYSQLYSELLGAPAVASLLLLPSGRAKRF